MKNDIFKFLGGISISFLSNFWYYLISLKNHFKNLFFQPYTFNAILAITMLPIVMEKVTKTLYFNPLPPYYDVIIFAASDK